MSYSPGLYLCLLSDANLQQNCVFPEPGRPYITNLFCVSRGPKGGVDIKCSFKSWSSRSRPVNKLLTVCGVKKCLFRYARGTTFCADLIADSSCRVIINVTICGGASDSPLTDLSADCLMMFSNELIFDSRSDPKSCTDLDRSE